MRSFVRWLARPVSKSLSRRPDATLARAIAVGVFSLVVASSAAAQSSIAWKFAPGDVFAYDRSGKDQQTAIIAKGQVVKQEIQSNWVYRFEVRKIEEDAAHLDVEIEHVRVQHIAGSGNLDNKVLERLKGAHLALVVRSNGEIVRLEGYEGLIEQASDKKPDLARAAKQLWPESLLRQEFQDIFGPLPKESIAEGKSYRQEGILETPPVGRFKIVVSGAHQGLDKAGHVRLAGTVAGIYQRPDPVGEIFRITGGSIVLDKAMFSATFDPDRGRMMRHSFSYILQGELTIELNGMPTPLETTIRREMNAKLLPRR